MNDSKTSDTEHKTSGEIGGNEVEIVVTGPEAQDLSDDDSRVGSDVVISHINRKLAEVKRSLHTETDQ